MKRHPAWYGVSPRAACLLLLALAGVIVLGGCGTVQKQGQNGMRSAAFAREIEANADPDEYVTSAQRRPVLLSHPSPPYYDITRVPARPDVVGQLDVGLKRKWKYIVVHHSFTDSGNEEIFHNYHKNVRGWLGVGYHFVIGNGHGSPDGRVEVTFRWEDQIHGAHAGVEEYNQHGIGICLVGNFERGYPTEKQMASLVSLVNYLQQRCGIPASDILLHRHIKNTKCPGEHFPYYRFLSLLDH